METIAFVLANPGLATPVDLLTTRNLDKAISFLEGGGCSLVYIAMNHLDEKERIAAHYHIRKTFVDCLPTALKDKIRISDEEGSYSEKFVEYVANSIYVNIRLYIFANVHYREIVRQEIDEASCLFKKKLERVPLFFEPPRSGEMRMCA